MQTENMTHGLTGGAESLESHASQKVGTGSDVFELSTVQRTLGGRFGGGGGLLVRGSSCVLVPASSETNPRGGESSSSFWCEIGAGVPFFHYPRLLFFCRVLQAPPRPTTKLRTWWPAAALRVSVGDVLHVNLLLRLVSTVVTKFQNDIKPLLSLEP